MRNVIVKPGHDCVTQPCKHFPKGEHGVAADEWWYSVKNESETLALVLRVISGNYPPTVTWIDARMPIAAYLHVHRTLPLTEIVDVAEATAEGLEIRDTCEFIKNGPCGYRELISPASVSDVFDALVVNDVEQTEAFWLALENMLTEYEAIGSVSHTVLLLARVAKMRSQASSRVVGEQN